MTAVAYERNVRRFEELEKSHPARYRFFLTALGLLGYFYVGLILVIAVGCVAACVAMLYFKPEGAALEIKLLIPFGILAYVTIRAISFRIPPPAGVPVSPAEAPALFDELRRLGGELNAPEVDRVLVDGDFNASVSRIPRFGIFGVPRTYLLIGLPLIAAVTPEEFRSILAHELGHHSRAHGRVTTWAYRLRSIWSHLAGSMAEGGHFGRFLFRRFLDWYAPYFDAASFVLARRHEYEADSDAARLTSAATAGAALVRITMVGSWLDRRIWPRVNAEAARRDAPPREIYVRLVEELGGPVPDSDARVAIDEAMAVRTGLSDTHPSLGDRLGALGVAPRIPGPAAKRAADHYLGESFPALLLAAGDAWCAGVKPS